MLRKVLKFQCPCGYYFEMFGIVNDAILRIRTHVERFHKRDLPFGITNNEALALLNEKSKESNQKFSERNSPSRQIRSFKNSKSTMVSLKSLLNKILGADIEA